MVVKQGIICTIVQLVNSPQEIPAFKSRLQPPKNPAQSHPTKQLTLANLLLMPLSHLSFSRFAKFILICFKRLKF